MLISSVILNWKNASLTIKCAESLILAYKHCTKELDFNGYIIVVDNGSDSHTIDTLKKWHSVTQCKFVRLIFNECNLGFSGGMNRGIEYLVSNNKPDYIWLLNNDLTFNKTALLALIQSAILDPTILISGSTIVRENSELVQCAGGCFYNKWLAMEKSFGEGIHLRDINRLTVQQLDYIYGAAMFIKADLLMNLNGLNESYFLYFEELDLIHRSPNMDKIAWCPSSIVYHKGGGSIVNSQTDYITTYHAALSAFKFTLRFYPYCLPSVILTRVLGKSFHAIKRRKLYIITAVLKAVFNFILKNKTNITAK